MRTISTHETRACSVGCCIPASQIIVVLSRPPRSKRAGVRSRNVQSHCSIEKSWHPTTTALAAAARQQTLTSMVPLCCRRWICRACQRWASAPWAARGGRWRLTPRPLV